MIFFKAIVLCLAIVTLVVGFWIDRQTDTLERELFEEELRRHPRREGDRWDQKR